MRYRGYYVERNPKPIPTRRHDWDYWPEDYDGPEDGRGGTAASCGAAMAEVNDELLELAEEERSRAEVDHWKAHKNY